MDLRKMMAWVMTGLLGVLMGSAAIPPKGGTPELAKARWWKGNLHAHSLYSDGNAFPETVVDWYRGHGYHFFSLTDHNTFQGGDVWAPVAESKDAPRKRGQARLEAYQIYKKKFGPAGLDERTSGAQKMVRLKSYAELAAKFDAPGRFMMIPGEEVTCVAPPGGGSRIHLNLINIDAPMAAPVPAAGDADYLLTQGRAVTDAANRMARDGRTVLDQVNHASWSFKNPEPLMKLDDLDLMEVNNGSASLGDFMRFGKMWDTLLAHRAVAGLTPIYATGVDDCHDHLTLAGAGKGWIMVRAARLEREEILQAIRAGEFYATSGVQLQSVRFDGHRLAIRIKPEGETTTYTTQFIGLRKGGEAGEVLAEVAGFSPAYRLTGDEVYVRAMVISSIVKPLGDKAKRPYVAWVQPCYPGKPRYMK